MFCQSKFLKEKAFSMIELLITISILLVIASVAAVSYSRYQKHSKKQLILSNLDLIHTGFTTCMKVRSFNKCNSLSKIKLQAPLNAIIRVRKNATTEKICFLMRFGDFKGCVDNSGNQSSQTELDSSSPSTACNSAGVCTP